MKWLGSFFRAIAAIFGWAGNDTRLEIKQDKRDDFQEVIDQKARKKKAIQERKADRQERKTKRKIDKREKKG